ncbi:uncharacterized protein LOC8071371 [Sorghum bicolor]|uniref:uncharacterized protein LOC8071371 n=1 Tax=Sorghum bicolor TaxID=4558 RepID=UPI000B4268FC|nr:uncharacterized protein LOC8071371 [Sorghum bicolor]|eukprot:XP_002436536.2 uncharacterized protein LOC8071371 [Sorghum bicolor]
MEQFPDGAHVRLRSRVHGGYLHADEDGMGVSLRRWRRRTMNAAWKVHRIMQDGSTSVLLHSAAYGRYLAASNDAAPPGHIGLRVDLGDYEQDVDPILWKVVGAGDAGYVLLRHVSNRLLRANGRYRLWLSGVSVDDVDNQSTMMHWKVETIPTSPNPPALARTPNNRRSFRGLFLLHEEPVQLQRTIRFVRADNYGNFPDNWGTFQFIGRSVFELRGEVARRVGNALFFFRVLMCVQGGRYGRLTPLLIDLPRNEETMDIIVLIIGTQDHKSTENELLQKLITHAMLCVTALFSY